MFNIHLHLISALGISSFIDLSILSILFNKLVVTGIPVCTLLAKQGDAGNSDNFPSPKFDANCRIIFFPIFAKMKG